MTTQAGCPLLLVVSAPSGAGKTSLCNELIRAVPRMVYSVSCTTRPPRGEERDGIEYHFISEEEFERRAAAGEFLEYAAVHGNRYGTLKQTICDALSQGQDVLMDLDVQGARQIRKACAAPETDERIRRGFVDVFIVPPSTEELRRRLCGRGTDDPDVIGQRMRNAIEELRGQSEYQHVVVNDRFEHALRDLVQIVKTEHEQRIKKNDFLH